MGITADDVRNITTDIAADYDVSWAVRDAEAIVEDRLGTAGFSQNKMDLIAKYIAAHLVVIKTERGGLVAERMGDASESYAQSRELKTLAFQSTRYGRMALALDNTGTLAQMDRVGQGTAEFRVV